MNRKKFIKKGLVGLGTIVSIPTFLTTDANGKITTDEDCERSPGETAGPFPNKTPAQLARENIISDRKGVALLINIAIQDQSNDCQPLTGAFVDIWHCDKAGNYSQYNGFTSDSFLRGRQVTDASGRVSFISIFPGWYPGRAPHVHVEVLDSSHRSLLITQIAFPMNTYSEVYNSNGYKIRGAPDTPNTSDGIFRNSLSENMADDVTGNLTEGYVMTKTIVV